MHVRSREMADLQQLLKLAHGCQVVTDAEIRSLEPIKQRLGVSVGKETSRAQFKKVLRP